MADESGLMNTATLVCVKMRRHLNFRHVLWYSISTKKICKILMYPHCSSQQHHPRQLLFTLTTLCKLQLSHSVSVHSSVRHQRICFNTLMWCRIPVAHSQPLHTHTSRHAFEEDKARSSMLWQKWNYVNYVRISWFFGHSNLKVRTEKRMIGKLLESVLRSTDMCIWMADDDVVIWRAGWLIIMPISCCWVCVAFDII